MEPLTLSVPAACAALGIARTKLYELLAAHKLDSITVGRKRLVTTESLRRLVAEAMQRDAA